MVSHVFGDKVKGTINIDYDYLEGFMLDTFVSYGVDPEDAKICADVLIASDKRGIDSHGIGRLKPIYCERMDAKILKAKSKLTFVSQTPTTAVVDHCLNCTRLSAPMIQTSRANGMVSLKYFNVS